MRVELGGRQTGRTTRMIEWLKDNPSGILIVHSESEAQRLSNLHDHDGIMELRLRIVSVESWMNRRPSFHLPAVAVDNADMVLQQLLGTGIDVVTMEGTTE